MEIDNLKLVRDYLNDSRDVISAILLDDKFLDKLIRVSKMIKNSLVDGNKILFAGNGGSAADAQHLAGEFVSKLHYDRPPMAGIALSTDTSVITAVGNDYGYDEIFSRQIQAIGNSGDIFVAISTSGNSENILKATVSARLIGISTIGFSGQSGGKLGALADEIFCVPSISTPIIQQVHITLGHLLCALVEHEICH